MDGLVWILVWVALLVGLAGVVLPLLPGLSLIWAAAIVHKLFLPDVLSWWTVGGMGVLALAGTVVEWAAGVAGVKWFGGTRWGMAGALVGTGVGLFFGLPGLIIGPLAGAMLAEKLFARRTIAQASKAGAGVAVGFVASTAVRLGLGLAMIGLFLADAFWWRA